MNERISVLIPLEMKRKLKKGAASRNISMSQFANEALANYLMDRSNGPALKELLIKECAKLDPGDKRTMVDDSY